jgi:hypothetical protein
MASALQSGHGEAGSIELALEARMLFGGQSNQGTECTVLQTVI